MEFIFDPAKNSSNITKHGISLADAELLDWETALEWRDIRKAYGEPRMSALGVIGDRVYFVAFTDRADGRRVISLRKANQREFDRYVSYLNSTD